MSENTCSDFSDPFCFGHFFLLEVPTGIAPYTRSVGMFVESSQVGHLNFVHDNLDSTRQNPRTHEYNKTAGTYVLVDETTHVANIVRNRKL